MTTKPCGGERRDAAGAGISGATSAVSAPASTMRMRAGTKRAPNTGATMKQAPMRTNGQNTWLTHASSCPVVSVIMGSADQPGMLSKSSRV